MSGDAFFIAGLLQFQKKYYYCRVVAMSQQLKTNDMIDRKCSFTYSEKTENGQWENKTGVGYTRSGVLQKATDKGTFAIVYVEDTESGQLHEVFANTIKFVK